MRILILANNDLGLYRFRKELIEELLKEHEVYISLPYGDLVEPLIEAGCVMIDTPVDRRGVNPVTDLKLLRRYGKILDEVRPDRVITYTIKPNIYGGMACMRRGIPYAANITGLGTVFERKGPLLAVVTEMYRLALRGAGVVFTENTSIRDVLVERRIAAADRICVLSGAGVNLKDFPYAEYPENETFSFLFIGRVMREKGVDELFEAVRRLNRTGYPCMLHVVGWWEDDYRDEAERGSEEGWLEYHGLQKDVRPYIAAADAYVLPSWHEGMANTNLESAASGRPVITSDIPGCREAVAEGETGFLCVCKDTDSLCDCMRRMILLPREERIKMGIAGRRRMEEIFDKNKVVEATLDRLFA